ncbi:MAG: SPASM domain-containing protein [Candidatus Omnitrophica bacterium]|nr:SPASM domain-containing protein [Candidatus Omnitrophota bacterium]
MKFFNIPFSKKRILFCPENLSIFKIAPVITDILSLSNKNLGKKAITGKLLKKYGLKRIREGYGDLDRLISGNFLKNLSLRDKHYYAKNIVSMGLHLSSTCNLSCSYCFNKGGSFGVDIGKCLMDWRTAKKSIDWFFSQNKDSNEALMICFFGGEPLLNPQVFKKSLDHINRKWLKKIKVPLRLILSTNGTLLNKDILSAASKHNVELIISLDASKKEHNAQRKFKDGRGSYDIVKKNIKYAIGHFPNLRINLNSVLINSSNLDRIFKKRIPMRNSNVDRHFNILRCNGVCGTEYARHFLDFKKQIRKFYLKNLKEGKKFVLMDRKDFILLHNRHSRGNYRDNCGAGINSVYIMVNGDIRICELSLFSAEWKLGTVFDGMSGKKIKELAKKYSRAKRITAQYCKDCWVRETCAGLCLFSLGEYESGIKKMSGKDKKIRCNRAKLNLEYLIRSYVDLSAEDAADYFGSSFASNRDKLNTDVRKNIKLSYLYRDFVNRDFKHIEYLNPFFCRN